MRGLDEAIIYMHIKKIEVFVSVRLKQFGSSDGSGETESVLRKAEEENRREKGLRR